MNNLFVFVCSFVLSEMQFGSTFLGMGLPGPKIDVCEVYERVIEKNSCWRRVPTWHFYQWHLGVPVSLSISPQSMLYLIIFTNLVGERWCPSIVLFLCFGCSFSLVKYKIHHFNYFSAYSSLALTTFMMCAAITTVCF